MPVKVLFLRSNRAHIEVEIERPWWAQYIEY